MTIEPLKVPSVDDLIDVMFVSDVMVFASGPGDVTLRDSKYVTEPLCGNDDVSVFLFDLIDVTEVGAVCGLVGIVVLAAAVLCLNNISEVGFGGIVVGVVFSSIDVHIARTIRYRKWMKGLWLLFGWSRRMSDQEEVSLLAFLIDIGPSSSML